MARRVAQRNGSELRTFAGSGSLALRAEIAPGDGRTITGYAVRWGELTDPGATPEYGAAREGFQRGAFAAAIADRGGRSFPFLDKHRDRGGTVVGGIYFTEDDTGLRFDGRLLDTPAARAYAAEAEVSDGVSLEVILGEYQRPDPRTVIHTKVARLAGLAGEYIQAYRGATVAVRSHAEGSNVNKCKDCGAELELGIAHSCENSATPAPAPAGPAGGQQDAAAAAQRTAWAGPVAAPGVTAEMRGIVDSAVNEAVRRLAERNGLGIAGALRDPLADLRGYSSVGELVAAAAQPGAPIELRNYAGRAIAMRALDDTTSNSGANAALLHGNLTVKQIAGVVSRGRPAITAFGGPRPISNGTGLSLNWPYFDGTLTDFVGAQSAQKAEITSASLDIKLGTEALVTYAGGSDVAYQLIKRGDPSVLEALANVILTAWGVVTDAAFVTELESGSVTKDYAEALASVDFAELVAMVVDTSIVIQTATGAPAEFVLASSTAFAHFAKLIAASSTTLVAAGSFDLGELNVGLAGLRLIHVPSITAGKMIMSNKLAAGWHEEGPFQASAEDVAKLGRTVAWWSLGAGARYIPAGIVEMYDVTP